jgi:hypothetical protein
MAAEARRIAPGLAWSAIAQRYTDRGERLGEARRVRSA